MLEKFGYTLVAVLLAVGVYTAFVEDILCIEGFPAEVVHIEGDRVLLKVPKNGRELYEYRVSSPYSLKLHQTYYFRRNANGVLFEHHPYKILSRHDDE